jgi:hypothetical protein
MMTMSIEKSYEKGAPLIIDITYGSENIPKWKNVTLSTAAFLFVDIIDFPFLQKYLPNVK